MVAGPRARRAAGVRGRVVRRRGPGQTFSYTTETQAQKSHRFAVNRPQRSAGRASLQCIKIYLGVYTVITTSRPAACWEWCWALPVARAG